VDRERIGIRETTQEARRLPCWNADANCVVDQRELASGPELLSRGLRTGSSRERPRSLREGLERPPRSLNISHKTLKINGFRAVEINAKTGSFAPRNGIRSHSFSHSGAADFAAWIASFGALRRLGICQSFSKLKTSCVSPEFSYFYGRSLSLLPLSSDFTTSIWVKVDTISIQHSHEAIATVI
jgi:hypothetical protein